MRVAIIGGGSSGLATLKWLVTAHEYFDGLEPIDVRLFEAEDDVGGTFRYRVWEGAEVSLERKTNGTTRVADETTDGFLQVPDGLLRSSIPSRCA